MRTSRTRALVLIATLSLGTFAFAQQDKSSFGSLTGEFQSAPVNSVPDNGGNGDSAKAGNIYGSNGNIVDVPTEETGNFESYSGPRRYVGGNGDTAQADRNSADFGSLTGEFQSASENSAGSYSPAGANSSGQGQ